MDANFSRGFAHGLELWKSGHTAELITHEAQTKWTESAFAFSRGMTSAAEALLGWYDIAERNARDHGFTREEAAALAATARGA